MAHKKSAGKYRKMAMAEEKAEDNKLNGPSKHHVGAKPKRVAGYKALGKEHHGKKRSRKRVAGK